MKKILYLSLATTLSLTLFANQNLKIPLDNKFLSTENGGEKRAIDAYSDGIGLYTIGLEDKKFSAMNELVFKYGEEAKQNEEPLKSFVLDNGSDSEKQLASFLGGSSSEPSFVIGDSCDDGNSNTVGDVYIDTNGTCQGTEIVVRNSIKCENEPVGSEINVEGISYLVVDNTSIKNNLNRAETLCTSKVIDMSYLFLDSYFNGDISKWDVSNVKNMTGMFYGTNNFNQNLNSWDVSNVTNMSQMFYGAKNFNQPLNNWNTSKVTNMSYMFASTLVFNQNINNWDTSNVTDLRYMFRVAKEFNQPLNNWNTSKVTNMSYMFASTLVFNQNINNWDTSNVTDLSYMFRVAKEFNQPLNSWDTSNVTEMSNLFSNAFKFNQPLNSWNTSKVKNMNATFFYASNFNQPLNNWITSSVNNMEQMFEGATVFNQNIKNWNVVNVIKFGKFRVNSALEIGNSPF
jgi:surface protein